MSVENKILLVSQSPRWNHYSGVEFLEQIIFLILVFIMKTGLMMESEGFKLTYAIICNRIKDVFGLFKIIFTNV